MYTLLLQSTSLQSAAHAPFDRVRMAQDLAALEAFSEVGLTVSCPVCSVVPSRACPDINHFRFASDSDSESSTLWRIFLHDKYCAQRWCF